MISPKLASALIAFVAVASISACNKGDTTVKAVDTTVTATKIQDTTVVKSDTTIHVDTTKKTHNAPKP